MNGKGKAPEKGRNLSKFRDGYDDINWSKKPMIDPDTAEPGDQGEPPADPVIQLPEACP